MEVSINHLNPIKTMKTYFRFSLYHVATSAFGLLLMVVFIGCSDGTELSLSKKKNLSVNNLNQNANSNSTSNMQDYQIAYKVEGLTWTYTITKKVGAKNVSHFLINLNNC